MGGAFPKRFNTTILFWALGVHVAVCSQHAALANNFHQPSRMGVYVHFVAVLFNFDALDMALTLSCKCRRHVADMSATCDTVAGFRRHGAVTATQNQLTVPTWYVGISMNVGRYTLTDDIFAKCVDMLPTSCRDI